MEDEYLQSAFPLLPNNIWRSGYKWYNLTSIAFCDPYSDAVLAGLTV